MNKAIAVLALILGLGLPALAQANLVGILPTTAGGTDYQAYYDTSTNLTWLANANVKGQITWSAANSWASGLSITGYVGGTKKTVGGWRLPDTNPINGSSYNYTSSYNGTTDFGYNITAPGTTHAGSNASEMAHLFYDTLGNTGYYDTSGNTTGCSTTSPYCLTNTGPFSNVQSYGYWSATEYAPSTFGAWGFNFSAGSQGVGSKTGSLFAWAVRSGDPGAAATSVPAPGSLWLMGAGLALLGLMLGRRRLALR